jgi:uncharacterized protein
MNVERGLRVVRGDVGANHHSPVLWAAIFGVFVLALGLPCSGAAERVSTLGRYQGYSEAVYDGWVRTSQYVTARDGTRIAMDILRPTNKGVLHEEPLPAIWEHRRYQRASIDRNGNISSQLDRQDHPMRKVVPYGYIFAVAAVRGSGASFGTRVDATPPQESLDAYDITEWLAAQPWCGGSVGMYGISYSGTAQFMAASTSPPHLKAIFPEMAMFDLYDFCYPGGIFRYHFMQRWAEQARALDLHKARKAAPVDEDADQVLLKQAAEQHRGNFDLERIAKAGYRDMAFAGPGQVYLTNSPSTYIEGVRASKVAIYQRAGWFDMYPRDMLLWFCNLDNPKKIAIGPWNHYQSQGVDRGTEMLRWFDYWLKGIDNGIMDEPPIVYCVMDAPEDRMIRWAQQWPLPQARPTKYYLSAGPSGSIDSVNDGLLGRSEPESGFDSYTVDYTTTSGSKTRWMPGPPQYPDMATNDRKALTYTTEPLARAVEIIGHPVVHLWLQCPVDDIDVFVYLEDVDPAGRSTYITDGCLRASHRTLSRAPYNRLGLPYSRSFEEDVTLLSDEPVELVFDLLPTAQHFKAGHRIRMAVTGADKDSYRHLRRDSMPTIRLLRDAQHRSHMILPVIE